MFKTTNEKINLLTGKGRDKVYEGAPPLKSKWVNRILRKESQREIPQLLSKIPQADVNTEKRKINEKVAQDFRREIQHTFFGLAHCRQAICIQVHIQK